MWALVNLSKPNMRLLRRWSPGPCWTGFGKTVLQNHDGSLKSSQVIWERSVRMCALPPPGGQGA